MNVIIAGRFDTQEQGASALDALLREGFERDALTMFYVNPAGQHDIHPIGGDSDESPGARNAESGAVEGGGMGAVAGAVVGIAAVPLAGPAGAVAAAGAGAYAGSLAGAMKKTKDESEVEESAGGRDTSKITGRHAGVLVAVRLESDTAESRSQAISVLRAHSASDIEHAQGLIEGGNWVDFDPRDEVHLV